MKRFILTAALLGSFFAFSATEASAVVCARGVYRAAVWDHEARSSGIVATTGVSTAEASTAEASTAEASIIAEA